MIVDSNFQRFCIYIIKFPSHSLTICRSIKLVIFVLTFFIVYVIATIRKGCLVFLDKIQWQLLLLLFLGRTERQHLIVFSLYMYDNCIFLLFKLSFRIFFNAVFGFVPFIYTYIPLEKVWVHLLSPQAMGWITARTWICSLGRQQIYRRKIRQTTTGKYSAY